MEYKDYYKILGIERTADQKTIQKVYRKLARRVHPDVNPGSKAHEDQFKEINEAYEVLGDAKKRAKYDQFGMDEPRAPQQNATNGNGRAGSSSRNRGTSGYTYQTSPEREEMFGNGADYSEFFGDLFGQRGGARQTNAIVRGRDIESPVEITLDEVYRGAVRGLNNDGHQVQVKIPPGVRGGSRVKITGQGEPGRNGGDSGDLYLIIEVKPDARFERKGDDLYVDIEVPLYTVILGGRAEVPTFNGNVGLNIPSETQNGRVFRLKGRGMPLLKTPLENGDLFAKVNVQLPQHLTPEQHEHFEQLRTMEGDA